MIIPNEKEIANVLSLSGSERYKYFIKKVVDNEKIWGLYQDGWALVEDKRFAKKLLPMWPLKEYAELFINNEWKYYHVKSIELEDFLENFIYKMQDNDISPCIFLTLNDMGTYPSYKNLIDDLRQELSFY